MKLTLFTFGLLLSSAQLVHAEHYTVDYEKSQVQFSGKHAGNDFSGMFNEWTADVNFDFENPTASHISAVFKLESAETGNAMYDGTLPTADWFNVAETPEGTFKSTSVQHVEGDVYKIEGELTLRDVTKPISFDAKISKVDEMSYKSHSEMILKRLDFGMGKNSDPTLEWVDNEIVIKMHVFAQK